MVRAADLDYDTNATAVEMAETIFGEGITVVSASYSAWLKSTLHFSDLIRNSKNNRQARAGAVHTRGE